jgi:hypothetical protein
MLLELNCLWSCFSCGSIHYNTNDIQVGKMYGLVLELLVAVRCPAL